MRPETARRTVRSTIWKLYLGVPVRNKSRVLSAIKKSYHSYFSDYDTYNSLDHWIVIASETPELSSNDLTYYSDRILAPHRLGWFYYHLKHEHFRRNL